MALCLDCSIQNVSNARIQAREQVARNEREMYDAKTNSKPA